MRENWIKWDLAGRARPELAALFSELGAEGYGVYAYLIEALWLAPDNCISLDSKSMQVHASLCKCMQVHDGYANRFEYILHRLEALGIASLEGTWLTFPAVAEAARREKSVKDELSQKRKQASSARWSRCKTMHVHDNACKPMHGDALASRERDREKERQIERETERQNKAPSVPVYRWPASLDNPEGRAALEEWLAYKRSRGETYKGTMGVNKLLASFADLGVQAFVAAVNSSMKNNYAGCFAEKGPIATTRQTLAERNLALSFAELQKIEGGDI